MDNENVMTNTAPSANKIIRYAILGVIALVALALVISIITALIPAKFEIRDNNSITWTMNDDDQMVFLFNGKKVVELSDDLTKDLNADSIQTDYNQNYAVFLAADDDEDAKGGILYVVNNKKAVKVKEEVTDVTLSAFGSSFLFISDGDLYYGQLKNPTKAAKVDKDVDDITSFSPNGKAFAYEKVDEDKTEYYISTNGKAGEKFGKKKADIVAISDGAKYVYYTKDAKFYVNDTKLSDVEKLVGMGSMIFNRDGSQIIFTASNDKGEPKAYLVAKAKDKNDIVNGMGVAILCPEGAAASSFNYTYYNTSTLAKCALGVVEVDEKEGYELQVYYLKNVKGDSAKISDLKNLDDFHMLEDGKTVLFTKSGNLKQIQINKPNSEPKEYEGAEEDIASFKATADGKAIYVKDTDGTLYYVKSTSKMQKIEEDIKSYYVTDSGAVYFVDEDEELRYANKSDKTKRVVSDVEDVSYDVLSGVMTVKADDKFGTVNGKKFKKLFSVD